MSVYSGKIWLDGDVIRYRSKTYSDLDLPVSEIRVIGESTNSLGPFADDYFFCFAIGPEGWCETSYYADGCGEFLDALFHRLQSSYQLGLNNSTDYASRVLWPPSLAGRPMFTYTDVKPKTWLGRWFGIPKNVQTFSAEVLAYLNHEAQ